MNFLVYALIYPFLWGISRLPWSVIYAISTACRFLLQYGIGYRKQAVTQNLKLVFPKKSMVEIRQIRSEFYKHMCDLFLEMIKTLHISSQDMMDRFEVIHPHTLKALEAEQKSIMVLMGHYASYEWCIATQFTFDIPIVGIYKKIKNPYFDNLVQRIRKRFDARIIPSFLAFRQISEEVERGEKNAYGFISDQSPKLDKARFWTDFMGIRVPVFTGGEALARKLDMPVTYMKIEKKKRGFYQAEFIPITTKPRDCEEFYITKTYLKLLEEQIQKQPAHYLWTHKRWKHKDAYDASFAAASK